MFSRTSHLLLMFVSISFVWFTGLSVEIILAILVICFKTLKLWQKIVPSHGWEHLYYYTSKGWSVNTASFNSNKFVAKGKRMKSKILQCFKHLLAVLIQNLLIYKISVSLNTNLVRHKYYIPLSAADPGGYITSSLWSTFPTILFL